MIPVWSLARVSWAIPAHSSLADLLSTTRFDGPWSPLHFRFSVWFKLWLYAGIPLVFWRSFFTTVLCFGLFSCWKTKRWPRLSFAADYMRFSFWIFTYPSFFMIPSILMRFPITDQLEHPHSIILPPLCFTMGGVNTHLYGIRALVSCHLTKGPIFSIHPSIHFRSTRRESMQTRGEHADSTQKDSSLMVELNSGRSCCTATMLTTVLPNAEYFSVLSLAYFSLTSRCL